MSFPRDLVEVLAAFVDGGVRFLVVGGHAVSLHARPRATKDLDLWLDATAENIRRIDLLQTIPGVSFASAWRRRVTFDVAGTKVPFIGLADLVANKRAVGRPAPGWGSG